MMRTKFNKPCQVMLALMVVSTFTFTVLSSGGITTHAQEIHKQKQIVSGLEAYNTADANQRLYTLTQNHIKLNMDEALSIDDAKNLVDFDGATYTLFELNPVGYAIYHNASGKYVEYTSTSVSPYKGHSGELYYSGAMQYYYKEDETLYHTLKTDVSIPVSEITELAPMSEEISQGLNQAPDTAALSYIQGERTTINKTAGEVEAITQPVTGAASASLSMTDFFPNLTTNLKIGYRNGGVCGYIAANLIIAYNYFAYDSGLISNSSFVNKTYKTLNGPGLTNKLLELDGQDTSASSFSGTDANHIQGVVGKYLDTVYNHETWYYGWRVLEIDVKGTLNSGYPVALFGNFPKQYEKGNVNHAVVAYQYAKYGLFNMFTKYRVHYGWSGYADVWLESPVVGTVFFMNIS